MIFTAGCSQIEGPAIKFDKDVFDFGEINQGESVNFTYKFKNPGNELLQITQVRPTCGCTVPGEYTKEVKPGKKGEIDVVFNSRGFQGNIKKVIKVTTNIPDTVPFTLTIIGSVYVPIEVNPQNIYLGETVLGGPPITGVTILKNHTDTPMEILSYKVTGTQTDVLVNAIREGEEYSIELTENPPFQLGRVKEYLKVFTNIEDRKEIDISYSYRGTLDIEVTPSEIIILKEYITENFMRILSVRSHAGEKIEVINPEIHGENMSFTVEEFSPQTGYQIKIFFAPEFVLPDVDSYYFTFQLKTEKGVTTYTVPIKNGANM
jgi:hypothetical protein